MARSARSAGTTGARKSPAPRERRAAPAPIRWPFLTTITSPPGAISSTRSSNNVSRLSAAHKPSEFTASSTGCCKVADQPVHLLRGFDLRKVADVRDDLDAGVLDLLLQQVQPRRALSLGKRQP